LTDYIGSVRAIVRDAGGYGNRLELGFHQALPSIRNMPVIMVTA
jgi:hypothetical protein